MKKVSWKVSWKELQRARELLNSGFSLEKLAEITKLPVEELKKALGD